MINKLLLQLGSDIPFVEAQIDIHQPKMNEVALIGENTVYNACFFIDFQKDLLSEEDRSDLDNKTNFEIFMSIMCTKNDRKLRNQVLMLLALLFPEYEIEIDTSKLILKHHQKDLISCIDNTNYDIFRDIIKKMFCLEELKASSTTSYNPADERARKIAEKLSKRKNKDKEDNKESKMDSLFDKYISILSVGLQKDKNSFSSYTIYQLLDEYNRFQAKVSYEAYVQAKIAGAENLDEVDHWMNNNLHS